MLNASNADVYTDFSGLAQLKSQAKQESPEALKEVAKQFESLFLNMVLKSMREAKLADGLLDSDQSKFYRDMYDQQLAIHLSGDPGIGLADLIVKQLDKSKPANNDVEKMALDDYLNNPVPALPVHDLAFDERAKAKPQSMASKPAVDAVFAEFAAQIDKIKSDVKEPANVPIKSSEQFVQQLHRYAERAAVEIGVEPKVLLAQAALETGWGKSVIKNRDGSSSFNLFNIKAGSSWQGKQAQVTTLEFEQGIGKKQMAQFRSYASFQDSFNDYVKLVKNNQRYSEALKHAGEPERYMQELQKAGYATDPHYADKVMRIFHGEDIAGFEPGVSVATR